MNDEDTGAAQDIQACTKIVAREFASIWLEQNKIKTTRR